MLVVEKGGRKGGREGGREGGKEEGREERREGGQCYAQILFTSPAAFSLLSHQSGSHYIDVNCQNSDGLTPMLLVTRDIALFEKG